MEDKKFIKSHKISIFRTSRILNYLENIKGSYPHDKKNGKILLEIEDNIQDRIMRLNRVGIFLFICYFGIYFSFVSYFFNDYFLLSEISLFVGRILSITGSGIFLIGIFILTKIQTLYYQDLTLLSAHYISIYTKGDSLKDNMFESMSKYGMLFRIFKIRGFY
jgi:hypothetical protein